MTLVSTRWKYLKNHGDSPFLVLENIDISSQNGRLSVNGVVSMSRRTGTVEKSNSRVAQVGR